MSRFTTPVAIIPILVITGLASPATGTPTPTPTPTATSTPTPTPTATPTPPPSEDPDPAGTISVSPTTVSVGQPVTITYSISPADDQNWIALFRPEDAPVNQEYVGAAAVWSYVKDTSGSIELQTATLDPGAYRAYALADDGYRWLAQPVDITVAPEAQPLHFPTATLPLRNAWAYTSYSAELGGLIQGDRAGLTFRKVTGPAWVRIGAAGSVRGTPLDGSAGRTATAVVEARNAAGETTTATIAIEVRRPSAELVPRVRVMTWNMWLGGSQVADSLEKQLKVILDADVDVIGAQETDGTSVEELGKALGWDYYQAGDDLGILSRYPIIRKSALPQQPSLPAASATIRLDSRHRTDVTIWNAHLAFQPYGPYDACFGHLPIDGLLQKEAESGRTAQIQNIIAAMDKDLRRSNSAPVLLTGDFNAASHLDWNRKTDRCGYTKGVPWPTSTVPIDAGLVDTYRQVHRDPVAEPGLTWSPIYKTFTGGYGYDDRTGEPEPQDRIDFVYAKGRWKTVDSQTLVTGDPTPEPDSTFNEWPSDHAAVITEFAVR